MMRILGLMAEGRGLKTFAPNKAGTV